MIEVYDSLLDVPLDEPGEDGDDSVVPSGDGAFFAPGSPQQLLLAPAKSTMVVPFFPIKEGTKGPEVIAWRRAMARAGYLQWSKKFNRTFGPYAVKTLKKFQKDHRLEQDGVYGRNTHAKLAPSYDAYSIRYLLRKKQTSPSPETVKRNRFVAELMYLYNRRFGIAYTQRRPFDLFKPPRGLDCSSSGEYACKWAGLGSPSGYSSFGYGNTSSQIYRFRNLNRKRGSVWSAEPGDFVFYGWGGDPSHVAYWLGSGRVWSFGSYPAKILQWNYRSDVIGAYDFIG